MDSSQMTMPQTKPLGRPRLKQGPTKPSKTYHNVHVSFTIKQAVIETFDDVGTAATLAKHFSHHSGAKSGSTRKMYSWLQQRAHIRSKASNPKTSRHLCSRAIGMATPLPKESEEQLAQWVNSMRTDGVPVTPRMIQVMALGMAIDVGLYECTFTTSWSWLQGFKKRYVVKGLDDCQLDRERHVYIASWLQGFKKRYKFALRARTRTGQDTQGDGAKALDADRVVFPRWSATTASTSSKHGSEGRQL
ncbi:hypothetical protein H257_11328 [Aphanomyces astaci]|uniref:HTH CENPB-type domain-containing protein n=1 Tax=Aphanomyces astaci TaxID=112090 RepID=W4G2S2_APHAT|nr:hypothetical protein H257_11328 [Aphanomyces astaci]ETV74012.1 hypothetical protein H257_11328 [Aphanomyces astaci]|eukprot:XP_009836525.1 hypothetical protein H257_11328 [Aphanomyces astaci]